MHQYTVVFPEVFILKILSVHSPEKTFPLFNLDEFLPLSTAGVFSLGTASFYAVSFCVNSATKHIASQRAFVPIFLFKLTS